jgi:6-phosphogluconolactonase
LVHVRNLGAVAAALFLASAASGAEYLVYAGTDSSAAGSGIYGYRFDTNNAKLKTLGLLASVPHATFLVAHPDNRFLYAVSEEHAGSASAYLIDPKTGKLSLVNRASSRGDGPCHLALDREGRWLAVANCGSGSVAILPLRKDGGLGEARVFPTAPDAKNRPHCVLFSPDNHFLLVADSAFERIRVYRFDVETGSLVLTGSPYTAAEKDAGPQYLAFHPNGRVLYASGATGVTAHHYNPANGELSQFQTVPAPDRPGSIAVNAAGTMVYASDRGADSMALLVVDPMRFTMSLLEVTPLVGRSPRHFALDPTGAYAFVANQDSSDINVYTVHPHTGQLRPVGRPTPRIDRPACIVFVPAL